MSNHLFFKVLIDDMVSRHINGDWGDINDEDRKANEEVFEKGGNIISAYNTKDGERIWIITIWELLLTVVLFPKDYEGGRV
jgi:hypothetical protein